jgi:dihydromonapterin reductase/dihydrofolate reductase
VIEDAILITGIGQRIGLHLAHGFLDRGCPVIGTFRSERAGVRELRERGAVLYECDFYDEDQPSRLVESVRRDCHGLRALIHNASDWLPDNADLDPGNIFDRMMRVHAGAPYELNLALAPLLEASSGEVADIVHVGDYVSGRGSRKHIAYAASKAAQDNLTLSFAAKLAPGVKVNSVAPALILFNEGDGAEYREKALAKSLMQREGGLDEFRHAVDYLLDSRYVTGRILHLDGGRHLK